MVDKESVREGITFSCLVDGSNFFLAVPSRNSSGSCVVLQRRMTFAKQIEAVVLANGPQETLGVNLSYDLGVFGLKCCLDNVGCEVEHQVDSVPGV